MTTLDEKRISEIDARVRATICPTFTADGGSSIEGRISKEDFEYLMCSLIAWRLLAKHNGSLADMTAEQFRDTLEKALEAEIDAHMKTREELEQLKHGAVRH